MLAASSACARPTTIPLTDAEWEAVKRFTERALIGTLQGFGFKSIARKRRGHPHYGLYAIATKTQQSEADVRALAGLHFPG